MKFKDVVDPKYVAAVNVYLDNVKIDDQDEIAGMLRGLMCAIEGWAVISGLTNDYFDENNPVKLRFSSVENAHYFKECVDYFFSESILESLKVKKIRRRKRESKIDTQYA